MQIIVVGCGRMGAGLTQTLIIAGHSVTVIDNNPDAFERLPSLPRIRTIPGFAFDREALLTSGIKRADGLAAVTASDDTNVVVARLASQVFRVPRVVARLYDPRKAEIYRRLGLQTINTTTWGINKLSELLTYSELNTVLTLGTGDINIIEVEIPPMLAGRKVNELVIPGEMNVIAISRGGRSFLPTLGTFFEQNDFVHLAVLARSAARLRALLGMA